MHLFCFARSSWELPDLREGRVKAISDSDGVSYPWYGNTTETVTLVGPTNKISRFSVSMNDNFYPSVTWAVPVSDSNVPLLTRIKRDQSFTTWLVAMNTTTKEKIILQTIKWRMRVDIEVDPLQLLGQRARLVGRTQQEQPRILSRMEPIPPNACDRHLFDPWVGKIPWMRAWQPTPVFLPGESPWAEKPEGLQSIGSQRVRHN